MDEAEKLHLFFQAIGDANRLRIIKFVDNKERSVNEIVQATMLSQPLVSHHLKTLKEYKILETRRKGPFIYYKLHNPKLLEVLGLLVEIVPNIKKRPGRDSMFRCPSWMKDFIK